jgi:hypothetical protein
MHKEQSRQDSDHTWGAGELGQQTCNVMTSPVRASGMPLYLSLTGGTIHISSSSSDAILF